MKKVLAVTELSAEEYQAASASEHIVCFGADGNGGRTWWGRVDAEGDSGTDLLGQLQSRNAQLSVDLRAAQDSVRRANSRADDDRADNTRLRAALHGVKDDFVSARGNVLGMKRRANEAIARIDAALAPPAVEAPREPTLGRIQVKDNVMSWVPAAEASGDPLANDVALDPYPGAEASGEAAPECDDLGPGGYCQRCGHAGYTCPVCPAIDADTAKPREAAAEGKQAQNTPIDSWGPAAPREGAPALPEFWRNTSCGSTKRTTYQSGTTKGMTIDKRSGQLTLSGWVGARDAFGVLTHHFATPAAPPATRDDAEWCREQARSCEGTCVELRDRHEAGSATYEYYRGRAKAYREVAAHLDAPTPREAPSLPAAKAELLRDLAKKVRHYNGTEEELADELELMARALLAGDSAPGGAK